VSADERRLLQGYIGRTELTYILRTSKVLRLRPMLIMTAGKYRRDQDTTSDSPVSFQSDGQDIQVDDTMAPLTSGPASGIEDDDAVELLETTVHDNVIRLWPWVNQVRIRLQALACREFSDRNRHL
jgi:hypothetical protein